MGPSGDDPDPRGGFSPRENGFRPTREARATRRLSRVRLPAQTHGRAYRPVPTPPAAPHARRTSIAGREGASGRPGTRGSPLRRPTPPVRSPASPAAPSAVVSTSAGPPHRQIQELRLELHQPVVVRGPAVHPQLGGDAPPSPPPWPGAPLRWRTPSPPAPPAPRGPDPSPGSAPRASPGPRAPSGVRPARRTPERSIPRRSRRGTVPAHRTRRAVSRMPIASRSHWMAAPAMKIEPSRA